MDTNPLDGLNEDPFVSEFRNAVAQAAPEELDVTPIHGGFDVTYRETLTQKGILLRIESTYRAVVRCDPEERIFTMTDVGAVHTSSLAGLRQSHSGFSGRTYAKRTVATVGKREDGTIGNVDSQSQDTRVLHKAVREPASQLGWTEKQPMSAKIGKSVAITTGIGLVVAGVVVGVLFLTGNLP